MLVHTGYLTDTTDYEAHVEHVLLHSRFHEQGSSPFPYLSKSNTNTLRQGFSQIRVIRGLSMLRAANVEKRAGSVTKSPSDRHLRLQLPDIRCVLGLCILWRSAGNVYDHWYRPDRMCRDSGS